MGRAQGFREEIQVQPAPRTTPEAGLWPSKRQQAGLLRASYYQLKAGHCLTGQYLAWMKKQPLQDPDAGAPLQVLSAPEMPSGKSCGQWKDERQGESKDRYKIRDLFADDRCNQQILDLLSSTDVGRLVPALAEEGAQSEASGREPGSRENGNRRGGKRPRNWAPRRRGSALLYNFRERGVRGLGADFTFLL